MNPPRQLSEEEKGCVEAQLDAYYKDPNGPGLTPQQSMNTQGARGKVNELYDEVVAIFNKS